MKLYLEIELNAEEEERFFAQLQEGLIAKKATDFNKPLTVPEFAKKTSMSEPTVYRYIQAGQIRCVPGMAKKLIPASELEKFQ